MRIFYIFLVICFFAGPVLADRIEIASLDAERMYSEPAETTIQPYEFKWLKQSEAKYICMVNDAHFEMEQIPVEVNGKIYYGCCQMCKAKLENIQEVREATDPVSEKTVDKATAIIGVGPEGEAYYFENEENMKMFDAAK